MDKAMKSDDMVRIQYASKQARIANYWKKWIGENLGIEKSNAIAKRKVFEAKFSNLLEEKGLISKYETLLPHFEKLYTKYEENTVKRSNFMEVFLRNNELLQITFRFYQLELVYNNNIASFDDAKSNILSRLSKIYKNYNIAVDKGIYKAIMPLYTTSIDASIYEKTFLSNAEETRSLLEKSPEVIIKKINKDAAYQYAKPFIKEFFDTINPSYQDFISQKNGLQKTYMKALMEVMPDERYFPDANGTLRVTYGKVKGYQPKDAVYYQPVSYLDGVMEKYIPNDYEFDVPQKLQDLYQAKDYGNYADANGKLPVCFLGTNHTTGGNSGSPALDANGNLIGLNFDRVWEGTMSDMNYDPEICRNIMVDIRYVLFIIDKYAGATHLIDEMKLVHPKTK